MQDKILIGLGITGEKEVEAGLDRTQKNIQKLSTLAADFAKLAASFYVVKEGLEGIAGSTEKVVELGMSFEKLSKQLEFATGSAQSGMQAMDFVRELAGRLGLDIESAAQGFAKLAASARGTALDGQEARNAFEAIATASRVMGLSTEETNGALLALSQMISKGKVSAEELRGQLGERLPGAFQVAARAMGVTTGELDAMLKSGLAVEEFMPRFSRQIMQEMGGAAEGAANSLSAAVNRMGNAWTEFLLTVANSGPMQEAGHAVNDLMSAFERDPEIKKAADTLGGTMATAIKLAGTAATFTVRHLEGLTEAALLVGGPLVLASIGKLGAALTTLLISPAGKALLALVVLKEGGEWLGETIAELVHGPLPDLDKALRATSGGAQQAADWVTRFGGQAEQAADATRTLTEETAAATDALVNGFNTALAEAKGKGDDAGDALTNLLKKADFSTPVAVSALVQALDKVGTSADLSGQQIQRALLDRLGKLSGQELLSLQITASAAFQEIGTGSENAGRLIEATLTAGMKKLGLDLEQVRTGFSAAFRDAAAVLDLVASNANATGVEIKAAFEAAGKAAATAKDFEALATHIRALGAESRLSKAEVNALLDGIRDKADAASAGINSVNEAFKTLGMKTPQDLRMLADEAKAAFDIIKQSGTAAPRQIEEAFMRYARAAIEANGGVADSALRAQAEMLGLEVKTTRAGDAIARAVEEAGGLKDAVGEAADEAGRLADEANQAADAISKAGGFDLDRATLEKIASGELEHVLVSQKGAVEALSRMNEAAVQQQIRSIEESRRQEAVRAEAERRLGIRPKDSISRETAETKLQTIINLTLPGAEPIPVLADSSSAARLVEQLRRSGAVTSR